MRKTLQLLLVLGGMLFFYQATAQETFQRNGVYDEREGYTLLPTPPFIKHLMKKLKTVL